MSGEAQKAGFQNALLEWRSKYKIQDGDPMLAAVELWEIYYRHAPRPKDDPPSFEEFRGSIEQLAALASDLNGRTSEIIQELRGLPKLRNDLNSFPRFALVFTSLVAFLGGILIGKFIC